MGVTVLASGGNTTGSSTVQGGRQHFTAEGAIAVGPDVALANVNSPYLAVYAGIWGTRYASPASQTPNQHQDVAFTASANYIVAGHLSSPYVSVYPWGNGFGTRISTTGVTLPTGFGNGVRFSAAGDYLAVAHNTSPFITVYPWTTGYGTKATDPGSAVAGSGSAVAFGPSDAYIAVSHATTPFVSVYPWSGGAFGTKVTDPGTVPASTGNDVIWSPDGAYIAVAHTNSPYISTYPWSAGAFGTRVSTTGVTLPTGTGLGVNWNSAGDVLAVAHSTSPNITAWPWSGGAYGTKYANPSPAISDNCNEVAFTPTDDAVVLGRTNRQPAAYLWSAGFGTEITAGLDATTNNTGNGVAISTRYIT